MKTVRVLMVEDNEAESDHFSMLLRRSASRDFQVTTARYLNSAYQTLQLAEYDVVLLDLSLPDSPTGIHTLVEFAGKVQNIPIIVLTGHDSIDLAEQAISLGAAEYLVKGEIRGHVLERAIVQSVQRRANENVRRALTYASLNSMERPTHEDPRITMIRSHIGALVGFFNDFKTYLRDNDTAIYETMTSLEDQRGLRTVIKDLRSILNEEHRGRKISERAWSVLNESRASVPHSTSPSDIPAARADVLSVIEQYGYHAHES